MNNTPRASGPQVADERPRSPNAACLKHTRKAPTARAREKVSLVVAWLGTFGMTTTGLVKQLLHIKGDGYLPQLERAGLVQGRSVGKMTEKVWTLTRQGGEAAEAVLGRAVRGPRADKINPSTAHHDLLAQQAFLNMIRFEQDRLREIAAATSEHDLRRGLGVAAPDLIWVGYLPSGEVEWRAYEIERNPKGENELLEKMKRLIYLQVQKRCDKLHVYWFVAGGEHVRRRYETIWGYAIRQVRGELLTDEFDPKKVELLKRMVFPTCSYAGLPEAPVRW